MFHDEEFKADEPGMYQPGELEELKRLGRMVRHASRMAATMRWAGGSQQQIDAITDPIEKMILDVKPEPVPIGFKSRR